MQTYNVLVADDEPEIAEAIEIYLRAENMNVLKASDGLEALRILEEEDIHLLILDVMMPRLDGIKTTHRIREQRSIPILMLSAKSEDTDKILGLNVGADDYLTKPFNPMELVARVKSQLRRYTLFGSYQAQDNEIRVRGLVLNQASKTVSVEGEEVRLTATEYKILELLMLHKGRVFSIEEIYEKVWKEPYFQAENTVAVHVRRIREKIEINPKEPEYLKVVWGIGYKMEK
ncbi:response regulator transcription factor [Paenibacillus mucilaginosus]|uniref:Two-component response regulator n=1 Tax=Paenibacillus mucilaginosus (strain KNP414) TaxID=1036673 RepID=F8F5L4_PAEMK|nr:response regulator transcription factor [Paenibacillus mucilaginosus]AEI41187.1 two-component response regulator [Paenibacillus mucilaginosus KNP414]MCG7211386.1 response regulator transcription factor [Paenibacillus mucilaginosus]WDM30234.1 response regulator transcription factor [Paenibacillus mucilaginosus]